MTHVSGQLLSLARRLYAYIHGTQGGGRRLFDKEADNPHEEPLLLAQLAAHALRQLLQGWASGPGGDGDAPRGFALGHLQPWCELAAAHVRAAAASVSGVGEAREEEEGGGGSAAFPSLSSPLHHPDAFASACRGLLALWAAEPALALLALDVPPPEGQQELLCAGAAPPLAQLPAALLRLAADEGALASQLGPLLLCCRAAWGGAGGSGRSRVEPAGAGQRAVSGAGQGGSPAAAVAAVPTTTSSSGGEGAPPLFLVLLAP